MSRTNIESQLSDFATALVENSGGLIDWHADGSQAIVMVPNDLAKSLGQRHDTFLVKTQPSDEGLSLSLGGEFLDLAGRTLRQFVPSIGIFAMEDISVKKTEFSAIVDASFEWQNARCKVLQRNPMILPYHTWWFHASLQSEENWETIIPVTINARSGVCLPITELMNLDGLKPAKKSLAEVSETLEPVLRFAEAETLRMAAPFIQRIDARRERDRKRLQDYYRALLQESFMPNKRTKMMPTGEEIDSRNKAVKLELHRKLSEMDERYSCNAVLRPIAMAEVQMPSIAIDVEIQRKVQKRIFRIFWNALTRQLEPMLCTRCQGSFRSFWFTNEIVEPVCSSCHNKGQNC